MYSQQDKNALIGHSSLVKTVHNKADGTTDVSFIFHKRGRIYKKKKKGGNRIKSISNVVQRCDGKF